MAERVDVLVVGAGPAGSTVARVAAAEGLSVLVVEQRPRIGQPVQCAEFVPAQIVGHASFPERCIAQRIRKLRTHLPDGGMAETPAAGYVLERVLFDKALAANACQAGAEIWTAARASERTEERVLVHRGSRTIEVQSRIIVGADGPRSTVGHWIGQSNTDFINALQVEAVLGRPQDCTEVYFDAAYRGGYGWLFPKGETANVGVGVNSRSGGDPQYVLGHLLERLGIKPGAIISRSGGPVPCGGTVEHLRVENVLLVGDAAGHTHPVTGAGIFAAVVSGTLAGQAIVKAVRTGDMTALDAYEHEWASFMAGPLHHALGKRRALDQRWSQEPHELSALLRETWIAFPGYARR